MRRSEGAGLWSWFVSLDFECGLGRVLVTLDSFLGFFRLRPVVLVGKAWCDTVRYRGSWEGSLGVRFVLLFCLLFLYRFVGSDGVKCIPYLG